MDSYKSVNTSYIRHFTRNPPARLCIQTNLEVPLTLSVVAWRPNQDLNENDDILVKCMHVQSISHWAPANIGPYSQAVEVDDNLIFMAGQIGLVPGSMKLVTGYENQAVLSLRHVKRVLAAYGLDLSNVVMMTCYVTNPHFVPLVKNLWKKEQGASQNERVPYVHIICVPGLPRGALIEWHPQLVLRKVLPSPGEEKRVCHGNIRAVYFEFETKSHSQLSSKWVELIENTHCKGGKLLLSLVPGATDILDTLKKICFQHNTSVEVVISEKVDKDIVVSGFIFY